MKKFHLFMTMLLTFCGVSMTAALLSLTSIGSTDSVSLPSQLSVEAGGTITVPVSLENSNPNYVGFQMDIVLPQGITPVKNARGTITPVKTDRLGDHGFSCNFDESSNTLKLVCTSLNSDLILGTSGELFSFDLQADASMTSGDYRIALTNVKFTTSSSAPEGAFPYTLDAATATLTVTGNEPATKTWTIAGSSELCGSNYDPTDTSNDMTFDGRDWKFIKTGVVLEPNKQYTYRIYANHSTDESYGERDGSDFSITVDTYGKYYVAIYFNAEDIISSKTVRLQEELTPPEEVITLYVKCDTAPFIWSWGAADGTDYNVGQWPGTNQFKNKYKHAETGEEFWTYTFPKSSCPISFLFNNGLDYPDTKQTSDIKSVNSDRWFYLSWYGDDGNVSLEDVTELYSSAGIPDAEVNSVFLKGNHNNWGTDGAEQFTAGQDGKSFTYTMDLTNVNVDENLWQFKFCPNNTEWLGFWDFFYLEDDSLEEGKQPASMAPSWLQENGGNFMIDLEAVSERTFTFDLTWGGGKDASKNWTLKATKTGQGGEEPSAETDLWVGDWYVSWDLEDGDEHKEWKALGQEDFANMQVGQVLYFYFGYEKDAVYHQYRFDDWAWEILPGHQVVDIYEDVKVPFVVTQDIKDAIAKMGFAIHGHGFRVTKVTKGKVEEVVETDKVFIPAVSAQAGDTFTLPVSLTNSNANYVGFQMDIVLPQGITPATEEGSEFAPTKTSRLADSHVFSCNFDASTNTLKLVCVSQSADLIQEKSGVLFYLGLKANGSMKSGDYTIALNNVLFTTSSSESEYAHGTTLAPVTATVSVETAEVSSWTVAGMTEVFGTYWNAADTSNDMTQSESMPGTWVLTKQNVTLYRATQYEYKVTANHDWYESYGTDGGGNAQFEVKVTGIYNLAFYFDAEKKTTTVTTELVGQPEAELLDVPAAIELISTLASGQVTAECYRVKGIVDHITESPTSYGNTSFYMVSPYAPNQKLLVYRAYGLNGENLTEETMFKVGDEVEIFGQLQNYQGTTPEMTEYSYLLSVNANEELPQSYYDLCRAILAANNLVSHPALKAAGEQLLADAISSAQETLRGNDDALMAAAAVSLNETTAQVQQRYMQPYETVTLVSADGQRYYFTGGETINGQQVTLTPMQGTSEKYQPYLQAANLRLFVGNQLLVKSDENIVKMLIDANITMQASTNVGEWADNQWTGNANEVLLTINKGSYYLYTLTVVYETVDAETLLQRLNEQIAASEQAVQQLAYANVLGASALNTLIAEAKTATVDTEVSVLQNYIKQLQSQTEGVVTLDQQYQMLATLMNQVEGAAQNNDGADATVKAAALDAIQQARTGLNNGAYGVADLSQITVQMNNYYSMLSQVYLTIHVEQAGTLASLIEAKGFNLSDVKGLTVSGTLNSDDMYTLQNSLTGLESLNMRETDVTEIPSTQFRGRTNLMTIVLPKNLETIGSSAFYNCNNLQDVTFPTTLRTIGASAFRYCYAFENVVIPEGVTSIGNYAFAGYNKSGDIVSQIKTVSLPSTLTSLSYLVFGNCQNLKSITCKNIVPVALNDYLIGNTYDSQCTLYVPAIAVSAYQNAPYWMNFQIQGTDIMPENIVVTTPTTFEWPATIGTDFRPNIRIDRQSNSYYDGAYGNLTVDGTTTVSMGHFNILWDAYYSSNSSTYNSQTSSYEYNRYAYCSLLANTPMRADQVSVNLWTRSYTWDFLTFPFDVKVSDIQNTIQADVPLVIRRYDGKNRADAKLGETWVNMTGDDILEAGKGYIWQSAANDQDSYKNNYNVPALNNTKKNNIFTTADVTVQLDEFTSEFSQNRSWNLIGNPYPAYYDIRAIQTQAPITIWNKYNQVYQAYSPAEDAYILNPGQAFFIQRPLDEESITFLKEGRQTSQYANENAQYGNGVAGGRAAANKERYVFNLLLSGSEENLGDRTRIVISSQAKADYEAGCDATKFMSPEANAAQLFTTAGNVRYAINERPLMDGIIELGLSIGTAGSYTIALSTKVEGEVYLIDRVAGTEIRLDGSEGYTFQAVKGIMEGRFAIRLGDGEATGISDVRGKMSEVRGETYNLKGQRIANPSKGLYIVNGKKSVVK